jgi:hypothetical protein
LQTLKFIGADIKLPFEERLAKKGYIALGSGFTPSKGAASGSGNTFLRLFLKVLRRHFPNVSRSYFYLISLPTDRYTDCPSYCP